MQQIALVDILGKNKTREDLHEKNDFTYIFESYYKKVYNYIYYRVNCHYTAEDLVSQVFEKVMYKIDVYSKEKSPFEVWLFAIARNTVNDYLRSTTKYRFLSIDVIKDLVSRKKTPEDIIETTETNDELLKALKTLDVREQNIIALKFGAELKNVEIAEILDLTESNVGVILYRAMKKLKKELERGERYNKKSIEDRFSMHIDAYFSGLERQNKLESEEYNELFEIGKALADNDFSKNSNKEGVYARTLSKISKYKGVGIMKKSKNLKHSITKVASIALVCILGFSVMQTASAQELVGRVLKPISLGHITVFEEEYGEIESFPVPEKLKGKIFDKDGNPVEIFSEELEKLYTVDGEEIATFDLETGEIRTVAELDRMMEEEILIVEDTDKLNDYTCFDVILPDYLPEGYKFGRAGFFKGENGSVEDSKYIELYFTNDKTGEFIYMQQRFADEETAYATGGSKVEKIQVNGVDAVLYGNSLDWEYNGVIYMLNGRGIAKDELIKIAESIK